MWSGATFNVPLNFFEFNTRSPLIVLFSCPTKGGLGNSCSLSMISSAVLPFFSLKDWTITIGSFSLIVYSINYHEFFFVLKSTIGWLIVFTFLLAF
jgi:hypothetical protein